MKTVSSTAAKNEFAELLEAAHAEPVAITKNGRKVAVLVSWRKFERLQAAEDELWVRRAVDSESDGYLGPKASQKFLRQRLNARTPVAAGRRRKK